MMRYQEDYNEYMCYKIFKRLKINKYNSKDKTKNNLVQEKINNSLFGDFINTLKEEYKEN